MKRAAAQETGRVTMRMPVSEEVAAAFESTRTAGAPPYDMQAAGRNEPRLE